MKYTLSLFITLFISVSGWAGPRLVGGGGDNYSLLFVGTASDILHYLEQTPELSSEINIAAFKKAVETTTVESTDKQLLLNGVPKDAINYPAEKRIIFNYKNWNAIDLENRPALVLHEYLGIMGVSDVGYKISKKILDNYRIGQVLRGSDSSWYLCSSNSIVINYFEHRTEDGRAADITLIFGGWNLEGSIIDAEDGAIKLISSEKTGSFTGEIKADFKYLKETMTIQGTLNLHGSANKVSQVLTCAPKQGRNLEDDNI